MSIYPFRTALVTGASSGIGESMVEYLAGDGVEVVVVARRKDRLDELAERFDGIEVLPADLNDVADRERVAERLTSATAPIELLVNNAGFGTSGRFDNLEPARLDDEIALNVGALTRLTHAAVVPMIERASGYILNVSSIASFQPAPRLAVYAATKAYVTSLSEALHEEMRGLGVHVTALCPGLTRTEFVSVSNAEGDASKAPEWMWSTADDVAKIGLDDVVNNRAISVPGMANKTFVAGGEFMPRWLKRRLAGIVQR